MFNRITALNWCQKLVFAQYLENEWTEFNQILYTLYHWHDLCLFCKLSFFANLQQSYGPWFLQVTRTYMKAWMSSNFNQIPPPTPELSALARLKNCCDHSSAYIFDWIFFIFSGNEDNQQVWTEFEFWPDRTMRCRVTALDECPKLVFA